MNSVNGFAESLSDGIGRCHAGSRRVVDETLAGFFVTQVPFPLEDAKLRADGGVVRSAGELLHPVGGGGGAQPIEDVHDLPLATGQVLSHVMKIAYML